MRTKFFMILLSLLLASCLSNDIEIKVVNNSDKLIDSFSLEIANKYFLYNEKLGKNKSLSKKITFNDVSQQDGNYFMTIYFNDKTKKSKRFGYFTNGKPLNRNIKISIKNDTILAKY